VVCHPGRWQALIILTVPMRRTRGPGADVPPPRRRLRRRSSERLERRPGFAGDGHAGGMRRPPCVMLAVTGRSGGWGNVLLQLGQVWTIQLRLQCSLCA